MTLHAGGRISRRIPLLAALLSYFAYSGTLSADDTWKVVSESKGVKVESRVRSGASINELRAIGVIDSSIPVVRRVLEDLEAYPRFMPFVVECRLLKRERDAFISYQRISAPLVSDRDYTLRVRSSGEADGKVFRSRWEVANALGPAEQPGVVRVTINEGSWLLEAQDDHTTRATYSVYTDGGALPAFVANRANHVGIGRLFEAMRKQVQQPKYNLSPQDPTAR
ncbi:MAG: hypothetical protein M3R15_18210 [Acidobacteriota bacterium]|nr:hypothetical protein [Acidobacteriota bacterium]